MQPVGWNVLPWTMYFWPDDLNEDPFLDRLYELMYSAKSAHQYVDVVDRLLDKCECVGSDPAGVRRDRRTFERASASLLTAMHAEAVRVSELLPTFAQVSVLDGVDGDLSEVIELLDKRRQRLDRLWLRLVKAATPAARRAAGDAVYCLSIGAHAKQVKVKNPAPLPKRDATELLNTAISVMGVHCGAIRHTSRIKVRSGRTLLDALAGVIVHLQTHSAAAMTLTPATQPDLSIKVSLRHSEPTLVEVTGTLTATEGGPSVSKQRTTLRALGFEAPTRKADDRTWHCSFDEPTPIEIPVLIANVLEQVMGVSLGDTLRVETTDRPPTGRG